MLPNYSAWIERKTVRQYLLGILFLLSFLQSLSFAQIPTDSGTIPVSAVYIFSLAFVPWLLMHIRKWRLPPWYITGLFIYVIVYAGISSFQWGVSRMILNWIYGAYLLVVVLTFGGDFTWEDWNKMLGMVALLFLAAHLINLAWNWHVITNMLSAAFDGNFGGYLKVVTAYSSLTRGGRNLDATWLCLCTYFVKDRLKIPYWFCAFLFSVFFGSRVGMIGCVIFVAWYLLILRKGNRLSNRTILLVLAGIATFGIVLYVTGISRMMFMRFTGIGTEKPILDAVLSGRKPILDRTWLMFRDNPFGYGCGNAMRVMKQSYGFSSYETNTHNVFTQFLLDEGFVGGAWFLSLVVAFLIKEGKDHCFQHPLAIYFLTYLILSSVQFHGGEGQMQSVLGVYLCIRTGKPEKEQTFQ